ncbi:MAG: hypothetical protein KatS3mg019_2414 [Fimbriimonadales bacterium]|nr:MAG: hypothetical protein KatS3mg019_2414 [Fimbriimonadales bacterium]
MQISLEELQKVVRAHRTQLSGTAPLEPVPEPFAACDEADQQLARDLACSMAQTPDTRGARVQEVSQEPVPVHEIAIAIMRRVIADRMSQD